jgi:ParB-like chromosome segregation protein Spo0J
MSLLPGPGTPPKVASLLSIRPPALIFSLSSRKSRGQPRAARKQFRSMPSAKQARAQRDAAEDEAYLLTLVENLQRQDLSPREESLALEVLVRERGWSTRQVAAAIERSQAYVSKRLRIFEDPSIGPAVLAHDLSLSAAEELLSVPLKQRAGLVAQAIRGKWGMVRVRQAARLARFGPNHHVGERRPGLSRRVQGLRLELRDVRLQQLRETDRQQLRLLFSELAMLARTLPAADGGGQSSA